MSSRPRPPVSGAAHDESEAPTLKWNRPAELSAPGHESASQSPATKHVSARVRKLESEPVRMEKSPDSGLRAALTAEEIERFERREKRETLPAPPEGRDEAHDAKFDDDDNSF